MVKYFLILTLLFIIGIHLLTPSWMLTDFNQWGDRSILFFLGINVVLLFRHSEGLNKNLLGFCIVFSVLFVLTGVSRGEEVTSSSVRLFEVVKFDFRPSSITINVIELVNLISILAFLLLEVFLSIKTIKLLVRALNTSEL